MSGTAPSTTGRHLPFLLPLFSAALVACTGPAEPHALVADSPHRIDAETVEVEVECADDVEARVDLDAGEARVPLVTIRGRPRAGRCRIPIRLPLPADATVFEDAASGMVVRVDDAPQP